MLHTVRNLREGYLGNIKPQEKWLDEKVDGWVDGTRTQAQVALKHRKAAYNGLQNSLQLE